MLHFLDFSKPFTAHVDASDSGAGAVLLQGNYYCTLGIITYYSKRFNASQRYYSASWQLLIGDHSCGGYISLASPTMSPFDTCIQRKALSTCYHKYFISVEHKPSKYLIPDALSCLLSFEKIREKNSPTLEPSFAWLDTISTKPSNSREIE